MLSTSLASASSSACQKSQTMALLFWAFSFGTSIKILVPTKRCYFDAEQTANYNLAPQPNRLNSKKPWRLARQVLLRPHVKINPG